MFRISVDDGCVSDLRVAELCNKYEVECVFYWPVEWKSLAYDSGYQPLNFSEALGIANNFEIGSHTFTHRHLTKLPTLEAEEEILYSRFALENLFYLEEITKFAPPRGYTTPELTDFTLGVYREQRLTRGEGLVHIHPNSGANNNKPWRDCVDENTKELWGHSWEWDKYDMWDEIEEFLSGKS